MLNTVIFDLDMTLVNSLKACAVGANMLAERFGLPERTEAEVLKALSLPTREFWMSMWGRCDPEWPEFLDREIGPKVASTITFFPDTLEILEAAKSQGHLLALATNRANPWRDLAAMGIAKWFDTAVGSSDVPRPKPDPDMILAVLRQLGVEPSRAIFVGDSPSDMACARGAGVKALGLLQGWAGAEELLKAGADLIRPSLGASRDVLNL